MAPRLVLSHNRYKINVHNNINTKKLNRVLAINAQLRKRIALLTTQNKEFSTTRNNLLLQKLELQNENNSLTNKNFQLTAMHRTVCEKLSTTEQALQECVPALVTLSTCIPSMLGNVREISKFDKSYIFKNNEKKERQTKTVRPMINGLTINQPAVSISRFDMSTIVESPNSESTPKRSRRSSNRNTPRCNINVEPYVRLKDVAFMLKNSKSVSNQNSSQRQVNDNLGEGTSWLYNQENQTQNSNNNNNVLENNSNSNSIVENSSNSNSALNNNSNSNSIGQNNGNSSVVLNEMITPVRNEVLVHDRVDISVASNSYREINNLSNETGTPHNGSISTVDSSILRNITSRKRPKRRSSESSISSDINDSTSSTSRSRRSATKKINYKEQSLNLKLRRN